MGFIVFGNLAAVITSGWFILAVCLALGTTAAICAHRLHKGRLAVVSALRVATRLLRDAGGDGVLASKFEQVNADLAKRPLLSAEWRGFSETLIVPAEPGRPVFMTERPEAWFDLASLFRQAGLDLRFHAAFPGILVGSGLLMTFLGLTIALSRAGGVVSGADATERLNSLRGLLDAASLKFVTSLVGLFFSILYALWRKKQLHLAEIAHEAFLSTLHALLPFRSVAVLQSEANDLLRKQFTEVQRIGVDFFVNLGSVLEQKFASGLEQHLGPLAAAIDRLAAKEAAQNEGAVGAMLTSFLERLEGAVGESMQGTAATLKTLESGLSGLRGAMDEAAARMARAAAEMTTGMSRGAQDALAGVTGEIGALVQTMRTAAEEAGRGNRAAGEQLAAQMAATAESLTRSVDLFQRRMEEGASQGVGRLTQPLEAMLVQLRALGENQRAMGADASAALADAVRTAAAALENSVDRISSTLGAGASNAGERLVAATESMRDELRGVLERFGAALGNAGQAVEQNAKVSGAALVDAATRAGGDLATMAARLAEAGASAGDSLRGGGTDARTQLAEAGRILADSAAGLGGRLAAIGQSIDGLAARAVELQEAARAAATPLQATALDLRQAAAATRDAATPLAEAGTTLRGALDGLRQASGAVGDAFRQAGTLAASLGEASERFRGVDQVIGKSTDALARGVGELERQVTDFVRGMDSALALSVDKLAGIAGQLEQSADELATANRKRG